MTPERPPATRVARRDWGESGTLLLCVVLFLSLRNRYTLGPPTVTWCFGLLVLAVFLLSLFWTLKGERKATRTVMALSAFVLAAGVGTSLVKVVYLVVYQASTIDPVRLIETALVIWVGNVIVFAIIYHVLGEREFAFPRRDAQATVESMNFLDYVFLSFTTATAFSPTDTSPLTTRARMFIMVESVISLIVIAIVAARAINILPQSAGS
jgi:Ion channel